MRRKVRELALHDWLEESDSAGVTFYMMDGPYRLPFLYRTGVAQLQADGISSCCYIVNVHNHLS
jgi:hypothetical protein